MSSYRFGSFILDVKERRLLHKGERVPLTPKVFDTLVYLVKNQGHLVEKDELMQAVWSDSYVEDGNLPRTIHTLRKALANGDADLAYIETVPTKGYRFAAEVKLIEEAAPPEAPNFDPEPAERNDRVPPRRAVVWAGVAAVVFVLAVFGSWVLRSHAPGLRSLRPATESGAAYAKFQEGRLHLEGQHPGDPAAALESFEAATKLDSRFAAAYAGKADAEFYLYWESGSHNDIARARLAIDKALELDPNNAYARTILCRIRATYDWDLAEAERECRRAVELQPDSHEARRELAFLLNSFGKPQEALQEMNTAIALAPTSFNKRSRGLLLYYARQFDAATAQFQQVEATDPEYSESSRWIARCLEQKRDYAQALEYLIRYRESAGAGAEETARLRRAFATGGWPEVLRATLPGNPARANMETAGTLAQLGETDKAFEVLEGMITDRRVMIVHMDSEPRLDPLRSDPRFELMAKRVGLR